MNSFKSDFAPLEKSLRRELRLNAGGLIVTPEQMVVELRLTPNKIQHLSEQVPSLARSLTEAYRVLRRHNMLPSQLRTKTTIANERWASWKRAYEKRRDAKAK